MARMFHVSSILNRESIRQHGLDWSRMGAAPGIAGSHRPEVDGCFLARDDGEAYYFAAMNNTGGPVDFWAVEGIEPGQLVDNGNGYGYLPARIAADQVSYLGEADPAALSDRFTRPLPRL